MINDELICNGFPLELSEEIAIPLNFSISDVKDIKNRARKFSKEIVLEGTANNCDFFRNFYSFTVSESGINFDATQKTTSKLIRKGLEVFGDGVLKLNKAEILDGKIKFYCNLFSKTVDYFLLLSNIRVSELGWSEYDHVLNRTNIKSSWNNPIGTGYVYPLIERGNGRVGTIWNTTDIVPYVYAAEVITKMYEYLGFTIDSTWLNTARIKSVLFGYGGGDYIDNSITPLDIADRLVDLTAGDINYTSSVQPIWGNELQFGSWTPSLTTNIFTFGSFPINNNTTTFTVTSDNLTQYDDGIITVAKSGNYTLNFSGQISEIINVGVLDFEFKTNGQCVLYRNGQALQVLTITGWTSNINVTNISITTNLFLQSGDEISFTFFSGGCGISRNSYTDDDTVSYTLSTTSAFNLELTSIDTNITDGGTVSLSKFIPDMLCSEFLVGFIRQFNLYTSDPDINNEVKILPFTQYYSNTDDFDDISKDVDHGKSIEILPIANEYGKKFSFKYKNNKDRDNVVYFEKWGENYGDYFYENGSFFAKGEEKIELPWSNIVPYEIENGFLIPRYVTEDNSGGIKSNKGAARLALWNGLKNGNWTFRNTDDPTQWEALTTYPCIHHFDDWESPDFDLNFQLVLEVFYSATIVTTINCFSEFYAVFVNELTNRAGQLVKCYVKWSTYEVKNKDFGKLQMIDGALFRLNKIFDFDEEAQTTTRIELVKVLKAKNKKGIQIVDDKGTAPTNTGLTSGGAGVDGDTPFVSGGVNEVSINSILKRG